MKKLLATLVIFSILSVISTFGYIYFSTRSAVDAIIDSLHPHANVTYSKFSNPMDGSIVIHNVTVSSQFMPTNISIGSIELRLSSVFDYINLDKKLESGELLPKVQLKVNHIYTDIEQLKQHKTTSFDHINAYITALGCGDTKELGTSKMADLGYSSLDSSLDLEFTHDKLSSKAKLSIGLTIHGARDISVSISIPNITHYADLSSPKTEMSQFEFTLQDLGYNNKVKQFCLKNSPISADEYTQAYNTELKSYLSDADIKLSDDLYSAYQAYSSQSAKLSFISKPTSAVSLKYINLYKVSDWDSILGLTVLVNGTPIKDTNFDFDKDHLLKDLLNARSIAIDSKAEKNKARTRKTVRTSKARLTPKLVEIQLNELYDYQRATVKINTKSGSRYKGVIKKVSPNQLTLIVRMPNGLSDIPISTKQIEHVYVYK